MINLSYNPVSVVVSLPAISTQELTGELDGIPFTQRGSFRLFTASGVAIAGAAGVLPLTIQGPAGQSVYATAFSGDKAAATYAAGEQTLVFRFGDGGVTPTGDPAEISDTVSQRLASGEVVAVERDLVAVQRDGNDWRVVGSARSAAGDGNYTISGLVQPGADVYLVALDDLGAVFESGAAVESDDLIHPATPNGYVYRVVTGGELPATEPDWWTTGQQQVGTATLEAREYLRPLAHGPVDVTFL